MIAVLLQFDFYFVYCVSFVKDELLGMKQRVRVVIVENEKLHEELKAKAVEDTLKEYTFANSTVLFSLEAFCYGADRNGKFDTIMTQFMKVACSLHTHTV